MDSDKDLKAKIDNLWMAWKKWQKDNGITPSAGGMFDGSKLSPSDEWIPERAYRIDVTTNFDENWYKRKYKSGLLNKLLVGYRNMALTNMTQAGRDRYGLKERAPDEMTDADKRKLDGLKWKMTNKIAYDYIALLLGYSRKKEYTEPEKGKKQPSPLKPDTGVGKKFAKKAMSNRGFMSRMKQQIFAGGQNSNVISVAFQSADWRDGWKLVESKNDIAGVEGSEGGEEGGKDGKDGGKDGGPGSGGKSGAGGGAGGAGAGKGSGADGEAGSGSGMSLLQRVVKIEDKMIDNNMWGDFPHPPRTKNKYDDDKKQNVVKESTEDPFAGVLDVVDDERSCLVRDVCATGNSIDELICDCILA